MKLVSNMNPEQSAIGSNHEHAFISAGKATHSISPMIEKIGNAFVCFAVTRSNDNTGRGREEKMVITPQQG